MWSVPHVAMLAATVAAEVSRIILRVVLQELRCFLAWLTPTWLRRTLTVTFPHAGAARGVVDGATLVFKGIPYAEDVSKTGRFCAPQRRLPWAGVRDCTTAFPPCTPQVPNILAGESYSNLWSAGQFAQRLLCKRVLNGRWRYHGSEEGSLALNIWCPREAAARAARGEHGATGLSVVVFVHGGGYVIGCGGPPLVSGTPFAESNVVFVGINYRLGVLGGLRIPGAAQNRMLRDVACALTWVRDNIAAVGGNPDDITLCGESAGAMATAGLLASDLLSRGRPGVKPHRAGNGAPAANGDGDGSVTAAHAANGSHTTSNESMVARAVCMSGAAHSVLTQAQADAVYQEFVSYLPADVAARITGKRGPEEPLAILNALPLDTIIHAQAKLQYTHRDALKANTRGVLLLHAPHVDGDVLPHHPLHVLANGGGAAKAGVELVTGTTLHEFCLFSPLLYRRMDVNAELDVRLKTWLETHGFGDDEVRLTALTEHYSVSHYAQGFYGSRRHHWLNAAGTDWIFRLPSERLAAAYTAGGGRVRMYRYDRVLPTSPRLGAAHATEMPLLFHTHRSLPFFGTCSATENAARTMRDVWTALAQGTLAADDWPHYDTDSRRVLSLAGGDGTLRHVLENPHCDSLRMWDGIVEHTHFGAAWGHAADSD